MEFKRVFHPVGQGAFFTETFFNKEEGYGSTIVYDCGSISSKELLYREIDNFKNEHKSFNILFISHFDADHVNGLKRLLEKDVIDKGFIDFLIKNYSIERYEIENLIRLYLVVQNPNDRDYILEGSIEELVEKYTVEKYLIEDIIEKYMIEKHIVENEPIKRFIVDTLSNNKDLIKNAFETNYPSHVMTLFNQLPIEGIFNDSEIEEIKNSFIDYIKSASYYYEGYLDFIKESTVDKIFPIVINKSLTRREKYEVYEIVMDSIDIIIDRYPRKALIEKVFIENFHSSRDDIIVPILERYPNEKIIDDYQIERERMRVKKKNGREYILKHFDGKYIINDNLIKCFYEKYIIDNLIENRYIENTLNKKAISKDYDIEYIVDKYIFNEEQWSIRVFIERYIENHPRRTVVVIPFLYPNLIKILLPEMRNELSEDTYDALDVLFNSGIKIVGLDNDIYGNFSQIESPSMNIEELYKEDIKTIKGFTKIKEKESEDGEVCWYYMPYNTIVDDGRKERFLIELFAALKKSEDTRIGNWFNNQKGHQIEDMYNEIKGFENHECFGDVQNFLMDGVSKSLKDHETVDSFVKLLNDLYKKASPGIKGVTAINVNSLNLLSYSSNELKNSQIDVISSYVYDNQKFELQRGFFKSIYQKNKENQWYQEYMQNLDSSYYYNEQMRFMHFSCLYTGDSVMENHFFDWIRLIRRQFLRSSIGLLQIPHHGRRKNYNKQVLSAPIFSSFINFKKGNKSNTFAKEIENDFCGEGIPCFEITQDEESRFVQTVIWNYQS